jgi:hypothetical protein
MNHVTVVRYRDLSSEIRGAMRGLPYDDYLRIMQLIFRDLQVLHSVEQTAEVKAMMERALQVLSCKADPTCDVHELKIRRLQKEIQKAMNQLEGRVSPGIWSELWTVENLVSELLGDEVRYKAAHTIL